MSYIDRKRFQEAMIQLCLQREPEYLVTVHFHNRYPIGIGEAERRMWHFDAMLDRAFLGPTWAKAPADRRAQFVGIPEGRRGGAGYSDLHYHLLLRPARRDKPSDTEKLLHQVTLAYEAKCLSTGSVDIQRLRGDQDKLRAASYICKYIWDQTSPGIDHFLVAPKTLTITSPSVQQVSSTLAVNIS